MPVEALEALGPERARAVANTALVALLQADYERLEHLPNLDPITNEVVQELATKIGVDTARLDSANRNRLLEVAADAVSTAAIGAPTLKEIRKRQGTLGLLRGNSYELNLTDHLKKFLPFKGLRPSHVEAAVISADATQHLSPPGDLYEAPFISIFVRLVNREEVATRKTPADWCLVLGRRMGERLDLFNAWRILQEDVEIDALKARPVDLLRAFAETFGIDIEVGPKRKEKFVLYERVPFGANAITAKLPPHSSLDFATRTKATGETEVAVAYCIEMDKYMESLRRHGVKVPAEFSP